jgi:hypothetical protein
MKGLPERTEDAVRPGGTACFHGLGTDIEGHRERLLEG